MAPELSNKQHKASTKSDVYSFGVILLESTSLMCATSREGSPKCHRDWPKRMEENELRDLFDSEKVTGELQLTLATRCVLVGLLCSLPDAACRPNMHTVLEMLADSHSTGENKNTDIPNTSSRPSSRKGSERTSVRVKNQRYEVLTEDKLHDRQEKAKAEVRELLHDIPLGIVEVLLRHCQWQPQRVTDGWFGNRDTLCDTIGLSLSSSGYVLEPKILWYSNLACEICSGDNLANPDLAMTSAGCSHYYCHACWRFLIHTALDAGTQCLRCPDSSCQVPVVRVIVEMVSDEADKDRYNRLILRSYVDDSGSAIKWCPAGHGCGRAIEFLGGSGDLAEVLCDCDHSFCWRCNKAPHWPVPCHT